MTAAPPRRQARSATARLSVALAAIALLAAPAAAETASRWHEHPNSRVRLVAGEGRVIGVELVLAPGWKTYWRMPGDAGVPPNFDWTGSENVAAVDVLYPAPAAMPDQGGTSIGYKVAVTFPARVKLADDRKPARLALEFQYGVCKDICIPVEAKLTLDVPAAPIWSPSPRIAAALATVPTVVAAGKAAPGSSAPALRSHRRVGAGPTGKLILEASAASDLFAEGPEGLFVPLPVKTASTATTATFEIDFSKSPDAADLAGKPLRLTLVGPGGAIETAVDVK